MSLEGPRPRAAEVYQAGRQPGELQGKQARWKRAFKANTKICKHLCAAKVWQKLADSVEDFLFRQTIFQRIYDIFAKYNINSFQYNFKNE